MPRRPADLKDEIQAWKARIAYSEQRLNKEAGRWARCLRAMENEIGPTEYLDGNEEFEPIAYIESIVNRVVPRYYFRKPDLVVTPQSEDPDVIRAAPHLEKWAEKIHDQMRAGIETRRTVVDALWANIGWTKVGYQEVFETTDDLDRQIGAEPAALSPEGGNFARSEIIKKLKLNPADLELDDRIRSGQIFQQNIDPAMMLVDAWSRRYEKARWVGQRIPRRVEDLEDSKIYPSKFTKGLKPTLTTSQIYTIDHPLDLDRPVPQTGTHYDPHEDPSWVMLYEIWDRRTGRLIVLSDQDDDDYWRNDPWPYQMQGFPFVPLQFNTHPRKLYAAPPVERWIALAKELNEYRFKRQQRVRRNVSKILLNAEGMTGETLDQLESNEEMGIVNVKNGAGVDLNRFIRRLDPVNTPPDLQIAEARAREDIGDMSGESRQRRGQQGTYVTATEAAIIENASDEFDGDRIQLVAQHQEECFARVFALAGQYYDQGDFVASMGVLGYEFFRIDQRLISQPWHMSVRVGSSRFLSAEDEMNKAREALSMALQLPPGSVDIFWLLRDYYRKMGYPEGIVLDPNDEDTPVRLARLAAARIIMGISPGEGPEGEGQGTPPVTVQQGSNATGGQAGGGAQPGAGRPPGLDALLGGQAVNGAV